MEKYLKCNNDDLQLINGVSLVFFSYILKIFSTLLWWEGITTLITKLIYWNKESSPPCCLIFTSHQFLGPSLSLCPHHSILIWLWPLEPPTNLSLFCPCHLTSEQSLQLPYHSVLWVFFFKEINHILFIKKRILGLP